MSWKVSPKKVMVTLLLIMITVYHSMTMLYYISGMDSSFLEKRYIIGTATMILAIFIIAVFKLHRYLKMPLGLGVVLLLLFVFPIITARMNYQEIYHTLISQTLMWIPICAASYYSVLYYGEFPVSKKMLYSYRIIISPDCYTSVWCRSKWVSNFFYLSSIDNCTVTFTGNRV